MSASSGPAAASALRWHPAALPPPPAANGGATLCPGEYLAPEQGRAVLDAAVKAFPSRGAWEAYAAHVRDRLRAAAGLDPWPRHMPLAPIFAGERREYDGYSVENVAIES